MITTSNINLSQISNDDDPIKTLTGNVITISSCGKTSRGRLIRVENDEIWPEKLPSDVMIIAKPKIKSIWRSVDHKWAVV